MISPTLFEKSPIAALAIHLGLSDEAAAESYAAMLADHWRDYEVHGVLYRARTRVEAADIVEDATGARPPLWAVVELY